jgi:hypothetical protein
LLLKKDFPIESHNNGVYTCMREKLVRIIKRNKDIFESTNQIILRIAACYILTLGI